jgi:four helix bundle protein
MTTRCRDGVEQMPRIRNYEQLVVWQKSMDLVDSIYALSASWPREETYRLVDQTRRAIISVPANIAEGHGRTSKNEFLHHLSIANGSLREVETLLTISMRQGLTSQQAHDEIADRSDEVSRLLRGLMTSLRNPGAIRSPTSNGTDQG